MFALLRKLQFFKAVESCTGGYGRFRCQRVKFKFLSSGAVGRSPQAFPQVSSTKNSSSKLSKPRKTEFLSKNCAQNKVFGTFEKRTPGHRWVIYNITYNVFIIQHTDTLPKYGHKTLDVRRST